MSTLQPHIPVVGFTPNSFILHNSSPERVDLRWGGVQFTIPSVSDVGPKAALDSDGDPIPGTLVLQDGLVPDKEGVVPPLGSQPNWLAFEAVRNVLGVDTVTKEATGALARAGVSFLPNTPTKDLVATVRADGKRRWDEHRLEWAQYTVSAYEARVQASKMAGVQPAPPDRDYATALAVMRRQEAVIKAQLGDQTQASDDEEMEFAAFAKAKAMEMAEKASAGMAIDKVKLAEELLLDPTVRANLGRKYQIRKRGHLDVPGVEQEG